MNERLGVVYEVEVAFGDDYWSTMHEEHDTLEAAAAYAVLVADANDAPTRVIKVTREVVTY